ncbi:MAG TPA: hypothetical protein ENK13_01905 [Thermopetrobacter sp.]|nr:hypothetical protein [Thermopetrobacter sp.]
MSAVRRRAAGWGRVAPKGLSGRNLLPRAHAPLRTFMVAMGVMTWLAAMAVGGMFMTWQAVSAWQRGVIAEATVQVMPLPGGTTGEKKTDGDETAPADTAADAARERADIAERARKAAAWLRERPEVAAVRVLPEEENMALLRPWLGGVRLDEDLPLPRLIAVRFTPGMEVDVGALGEALSGAVKGVRLDAHGRWVLELARLGRSALWLGLGILLAIIAAAVVLVVYAARTALESNREVIEVLHLVGARDSFIARQVQRRFLSAGFLAGLAGVAAAWLTLAAIALFAPAGGLSSTARQLLFGAPVDVLPHYGAWLIIVVVATLISLTSARAAAMRILHDMFRDL